jgi:hypothetical protein
LDIGGRRNARRRARRQPCQLSLRPAFGGKFRWPTAATSRRGAKLKSNWQTPSTSAAKSSSSRRDCSTQRAGRRSRINSRGAKAALGVMPLDGEYDHELDRDGRIACSHGWQRLARAQAVGADMPGIRRRPFVSHQAVLLGPALFHRRIAEGIPQCRFIRRGRIYGGQLGRRRRYDGRDLQAAGWSASGRIESPKSLADWLAANGPVRKRYRRNPRSAKPDAVGTPLAPAT